MCGVQDAREGNEPINSTNLLIQDVVMIEGVRVPRSSLAPYLLVPPPRVLSLILKRVRTMKVTPVIPLDSQPSAACTTMVRSAGGRGEVVSEVPAVTVSPTFYREKCCLFASD